jgi:tRNA (guanine-N7-)-methyltransferase
VSEHPKDGRFRDKPPEAYRDPDLNPYLKLHREFGRPALTAGDAAAIGHGWATEFGRAAPLHVEIGAGNGFFLSGMSAAHPEQDWLGLEIRFKRVVQTARKLVAAGVSNARVARYDGRQLDDLLAQGSVAGLYINHPDPWPKDRHAKNRLFHPDFVDACARWLAPGARLRLKTDFVGHIEALTALTDGRPLAVVGRSDHIERDGAPWGEDDVVTNYQGKFDRRGLPVYALWVARAG